MKRTPQAFSCSLLLAAFIPLLAIAAGADDDVDLSVVHRIKHEAFRNSQVMDHMFSLSDRFGPRISGSPAYRAAAQWSADLLESWKLENAGLESWGVFGRGWSLDRYSAHMVEPVYAALPGIPGAWTAGTKGRVTAMVVAAHLYETEEDENVVNWDLDKLAASLPSGRPGGRKSDANYRNAAAGRRQKPSPHGRK